jgi:D-aminoacyl-tRNA deacylase
VRAVVQRVSWAAVRVRGTGGEREVGRIGAGLLVLLAVAPDDADDPDGRVRWMGDKLANLRVFADEEGRMNRSLLDIGGGALVVSQFTLYGDCRKGRRPSFVGAADPALAEPLYLRVCARLVELGVAPVEHGVFGADMAVELLNSGPVTLILDAP